MRSPHGKGIWVNASGAAAVEFALLAPFLILCLVAVVDLGVGIWRSIQMTNAASYATAYVLADPDASDAEISAAVSAAVPDMTVTTVRSSFCECDGTPMQSCGSSCGGTVTEYVKVKTSTTVDTIITYPGFEYPIEVTGVATKVVP